MVANATKIVGQRKTFAQPLRLDFIANYGHRGKLEEKEKQGFYSIMDALIAKKKLKDTLSNAIDMA